MDEKDIKDIKGEEKEETQEERDTRACKSFEHKMLNKQIWWNSIAIFLILGLTLVTALFWPNQDISTNVALVVAGIGMILFIAIPLFVDAGRAKKEAMKWNDEKSLGVFVKNQNKFGLFVVLMGVLVGLVGYFSALL